MERINLKDLKLMDIEIARETYIGKINEIIDFLNKKEDPANQYTVYDKRVMELYSLLEDVHKRVTYGGHLNILSENVGQFLKKYKQQDFTTIK